MRQFSAWLSAMAGLCDWVGYVGLHQDHDQVVREMDRESEAYERLGLAVLDRLGDGWHTARAVTSDTVTQDLLPRPDSVPADRHIGHRSAGRDVLGPRVGRRDGAVRLERRWGQPRAPLPVPVSAHRCRADH